MPSALRLMPARRRLLRLGAGLLLAGATLWAPAASWAAGQPAKAEASSPEQLRLAEHLKRVGMIFYGAWWCSHCQHQKALFGSPAQERLPYVECDKEESGRERCNAAQVRAYPSWDFKGERREGVLSLEELKQWSGYRSSPGAGSSR
ncbi:MAG: hypothetical protein ACKO1Q_00360 [Vulcanococcus sp.]